MDLMTKMTTEDVKQLRVQFSHPVPLEEFVVLMKKSLADRIHNELDFVVGAIDLFHTIDVNGDGTIEWDEFAEFILDVGVAKADFIEKEEQISLDPKSYKKCTTSFVSTNVSSNSSSSSRSSISIGSTSGHPQQKVLMPRAIAQLLYLPNLYGMASFERNTDIVMLFSFHFETNELPRQVATIRLHTSFVEHTIVCMEYIPTKNQLITSSVLSMGYLSFWDISNLNSPTLVHRMEMATPLELVIWMPTLHACICTAIIFPALQQTILHTPTTGTSKRHSSKTEGGGSYHPHDLSTSSQAKLSELVLVDIQHFTYHALMDHELLKGVSAMISIGKSLCNRLHIAVGRSDGVLCLVDMEKSTNDTISSHDDDVDHSHIVRPSTSTNIGTATLVDAHGSGVRALAYSHEFQYLASIGNFVVTDATTLHIIIWKAKTNSQHHSYGQHYHNYSNAQSVLKLHMTIDGHHAPLDTIIFVDAEKQFISSDTSGMFRIYSTLARNFRLLQIFQVQPNPLGASLPGTATCSYPKFLVVPENNAKNTDAILVVYTSNPNHLPGHQHAIEFYERSEIRSREEILFAHYCISLNFILCISSSRLLLWNAETGALLKVHYYKNMYMSKSEGKGRRCLTTVQKGGGDDGDGTSDFGSGAGGQDTLNTTILGDTRAEEPSEIKPRNITAACVDDRGRKAILGDDLGAIRVVNIVNGNVMKKLDPHQHAINYLSYMRYARRVISCCVDGTIHICDENNIVGYYVPFRGLSQSVLIQSIRFLPSKTPTFTGITGENTPLSQRSPSRMGNCEKKNGNDSSQLASSKTNDKFDVCKAVANAQLNLIAVLFNGNNAAQNVNESFIQVWNLEFNHAQGTCIAPDRSEITCLEFFGSIGSILGGTSIGGVYLWTPVKNRPLYCCSIEFKWESPAISSLSSLPVGSITSVTTASISNANIVCSNSCASSSITPPSTSVTELTTTADNMSFSFPTRSSFNVRRSTSSTSNSNGVDGTFIFASDDRGHITQWFVKNLKEEKIASIYVPKYQNKRLEEKNTIISYQHEEIQIEYDMLTTLYHSVTDNFNEYLALNGGVTLHVSPKRQWKAHNTGVLYLSTSKDPDTLFSTSTNGKLKSWVIFDGNFCGVLDYYATRRKPIKKKWMFPIDMQGRRRQKEKEANLMIARIGMSPEQREPPRRFTLMQQRLNLETLTQKSEDLSARRLRNRHQAIYGNSHSADLVRRSVRNHILAQAVLPKNKYTDKVENDDEDELEENDGAEVISASVLEELKKSDLKATALQDAFKPRNKTEVKRKKYLMVTVADHHLSMFTAASVSASSPSSVLDGISTTNPTKLHTLVVPLGSSRNNDVEHLPMSTSRKAAQQKDRRPLTAPCLTAQARPASPKNLLPIERRCTTGLGRVRPRKQGDTVAPVIRCNNSTAGCSSSSTTQEKPRDRTKSVLSVHLRLNHSWHHYPS